MQHSQKNFMRIIGNDQKSNGKNFWEILERIIGKILSIIGAGLASVLFLNSKEFCEIPLTMLGTEKVMIMIE